MLSVLHRLRRKTFDTQTARLLSAIAFVSILPLVFVSPALSQDPSGTDVHIAPRGMATDRPAASRASSLDAQARLHHIDIYGIAAGSHAHKRLASKRVRSGLYAG